MACYLYGKKMDDDHLWGPYVKVDKPREYGKGPLCLRCGLSLGTYQFEAAGDRHKERTGHHLHSGACEGECGDLEPWWDYEPWPGDPVG